MTLEAMADIARNILYLAMIAGALVLSGMLGTGGAAKIARLRVDDMERRRLTGASLILWLVSSAAVMAVGIAILPGGAAPLAVGCALALLRLALSLKFDLRAAMPGGEDFDALLRAGIRPLIASALFLPAALVSRSLLGAVFYAALLLAADVASKREESEKKRATGLLTALALALAIPLALLPGRLLALTALAFVYLVAVLLIAGPGALLCLPASLYEAYLPVRAYIIRRRSAR